MCGAADTGGQWVQMSLHPPGNSPGACMPFFCKPQFPVWLLFFFFNSGNLSLWGNFNTSFSYSYDPQESLSLPVVTRKLPCIHPGSGCGCRGGNVTLWDKQVTSGAGRRLSSA